MKLKLEIQLCIKYLASNHISSVNLRKKCVKQDSVEDKLEVSSTA